MRTLSAACVLALVLPSLCLAQSLGAAAAKEKERRKKNQEAGAKARVIGDEDMAAAHEEAVKNGPSPAPATPPPLPLPGPGPVPAEERSSESDDGRKAEEAAWRARMAQAQARVARARKTYEGFSHMYLVNGEYYVDDRGRTVIGSLEQLQRLTARAKAELEAAEKAVETLEEQARRAGVPPGWLR